MQLLVRSLRRLTKSTLLAVNNFLDKQAQPTRSISKMMHNSIHYSPLLNPSLALKRSLKYANQRLTLINNSGKSMRLGWIIGLIGILLGLTIDYWHYVKLFYQQRLERAQESLTRRASGLVDKQVLKHEGISTQLEKLIYGLCISVNVQHLTTESINKVLSMQQIRQEAQSLTKLLLVQKVFKSIAQDKLKQVIVALLQNQSNQQFIQEKTLEYLSSNDFQTLITQQLRDLLLGTDLHELLSSITTSIVKGNLTSIEFKHDVYKYIKQRLL